MRAVHCDDWSFRALSCDLLVAKVKGMSSAQVSGHFDKAGRTSFAHFRVSQRSQVSSYIPNDTTLCTNTLWSWRCENIFLSFAENGRLLCPDSTCVFGQDGSGKFDLFRLSYCLCFIFGYWISSSGEELCSRIPICTNCGPAEIIPIFNCKIALTVSQGSGRGKRVGRKSRRSVLPVDQLDFTLEGGNGGEDDVSKKYWKPECLVVNVWYVRRIHAAWGGGASPVVHFAVLDRG